jgi:hypothetical protein
MQIGAPGENGPQIQQDDPGEQTQGQTEGEASAPAGAGDRLILAIRFAAIGGPRFRR